MSDASNESLDAAYQLDDERSAGVQTSSRRPDRRSLWRSPPSDASDTLTDLLRPAAVHPLVDQDNQLDIESSLSSSLSSFAETAATPPPLQPPALDRLQHLQCHMKQLKRLYRQEVQQEELAHRDSLLQMLCSSSITLFRHCPSPGRFFTAVRALLCQYLPAQDSKLLEVDHFNGHYYVIAQAKDQGDAKDLQIELSELNIVDQWDRIGIAGRAAALAGTSFKREEAVGRLDSSCIERWGRSVARYVVSCPNKHLVLQIPASELLQTGFRPEIDLAIPSSTSKKAQDTTDSSPIRLHSRRRGRGNQEQGSTELQLLVVVLQDAQGRVVAVFQAVVDASTRLSIEFLDAFGVLLTSAVEMRRKVCRSMVGDVDVQICRSSSIDNASQHRTPVLRVPISSDAATDWEIVAFKSGAVLKATDPALLRAVRKPIESLLMDKEARDQEIAYYQSVVRCVAPLWERLHGFLSSSDTHDWCQCLRLALGNLVDKNDTIEGIQRIRVLFPGESGDDYREVYTVSDAVLGDDRSTASREFEVLKQVAKSRQSMEVTESGLYLTAVPVEVRPSFEPGSSTCSVIGVSVAIEDVDGDDGGLMQRVKHYLLPVLCTIVQASMELAMSHKSTYKLQDELSSSRTRSEHYERDLALMKEIAEAMEQWAACRTVDELVDAVAALTVRNISDSLVRTELYVVEVANSHEDCCDDGSLGKSKSCCVWTRVGGDRVVSGNTNSPHATAKEVAQLVISRDDAKTQNSRTSWTGYCGERHVIPLHSPTDKGRVLGALELELSDTARLPDLLSAIDPLLRLLPHILNAHFKTQSTQSAYNKQIKSLTDSHETHWNTLMKCVAKWSNLLLSNASWSEQTSSLCHQLVPSADFVNVFLAFGDSDNMISTASVATKLAFKGSEEVMDEVTRNALCLRNQCVLGAIAHYSLSDGQEALGVLVASKKGDAPFSSQEHQLLQLFAHLVSAQASTLRIEVEARRRVDSLQDKLEKQSTATRQLFEAHATVSARAQQLLILLGVAKLARQVHNGGPETVFQCLQSAVQHVQQALTAVGSQEIVVAVCIDRSRPSKPSYSAVAGVDTTATGLEECIVLDGEEDYEDCWYSTRRWMRHSPPFSAIPPHILHLLGVHSEPDNSHGKPDLLTVVPVDLHNADEGKRNVVLIVITSFEAGGLVDDTFTMELVESVANLLTSRLQVSKLTESTSHLSASVTTLDSKLVELQQDYRLLELTHIVWMEVGGSGTPALDSSIEFGEPEGERPMLQRMRKSLRDRIIPFLREELRIYTVDLLFDCEDSGHHQQSRKNSIDCFMNSIVPSRAQILKSSTDCVTLGVDSPSTNSPPRYWLLRRFIQRDTEDSRCFGLFYIEWELLSSFETDTEVEKTKGTLVWLSDWLETLALYCFDRYSALDRIWAGQQEVHALTVRNRAQAERIKVHARWNDRWAPLVEFARALQAEMFEMSATPGGDGASDWEFVCGKLSALNDIDIWSRRLDEHEDVAWTIRPDGTRQCEKWSEVMSRIASDPDRFQLITTASSPPSCIGVLELSMSGDQPWSSEYAATYRELASLIVGSFLTTRSMHRSSEHSRCITQVASDRLEAELDQLRQDSASSWTAYQLMEQWIQQLRPIQGTRQVESDASTLQQLFGRIERQLVDTTRGGGRDIVRGRLLLQTGGDQEMEMITSCRSGCACHRALSLVEMLKRIDTSDSRTEAVTVTVVDNLHKVFDACEQVHPVDTSDGSTHSVVLRTTSKVKSNLALILCVQMKTSDLNTATVTLLQALCLRLGDAATQFLEENHHRKQFDLVHQRLAATSSELDEEKRRSTRLATAMATATRCVTDALSSPVGESGEAVVGAIQVVAQCFVDGPAVVQLIHKQDKSEAAAVVTEPPPLSVDYRRRLADTDDERVECVRTAEGEIDRIELVVQGARILIAAPVSGGKADLSPLWEDKPALELIVTLSNALVAIKKAKGDALTHRQECDITAATLQAKCAALEVACLGATTALDRSEKQRSWMRTAVKQTLEPIPTQAVEFITQLATEACTTKEAVIQALGDSLMGIYAVESVAIRELSSDNTRTLYTSTLPMKGEHQLVLDSEQARRVLDRCVGRQETEILSLKTSSRDTNGSCGSDRARRTWLVVTPCVVGTTSMAVLLLISSDQLERSVSRKELHQVNHAKLLIQLAVWRCDQLVRDSSLTIRSEQLAKTHQETDEALQHTKIKLYQAQEDQQGYRRMLCGVASDAFQALSWSDKTWQRVFPSTKKLAVVWQHLSNVLRDRIATDLASVRAVRVQIFGVIRSQELVLRLPPATTKFGYVTMMKLAADPSMRSLWDALTTPTTPECGLYIEEVNGSTTLVVPATIRDGSGRDGLPIGAVVVTMTQSESLVLSDAHKRATCDLVNELSPIINGGLRAVRVKRTGVTSRDEQHRDHRPGEQQVPVVSTSLWPSLGRASDSNNQSECPSTNVLASNITSRQEVHNVEDIVDGKHDEEDRASTATSLDSSHYTTTKSTDSRLVEFLLKLQGTRGLKALQRLVADELKAVWTCRSSRSTPHINFELVVLPEYTKGDYEHGQAVDLVHCTLLPEAALTEVLQRVKGLGPTHQPRPPPLWKFSADSEGKRATGDEFWVAVFTQPTPSSGIQASTGLLVVRGVRLQSVISRQDALHQALQGIQQHLACLRHNAGLQARISDLEQHVAEYSELSTNLTTMATQHRHSDSFSKLAVQLSVAHSESEVVRATRRYLSDLLQCRLVVYEPSKRGLSTKIVSDVYGNQECDRDESVLVELGQSLSSIDNNGEDNDDAQQVSKLAVSSRAVVMQHSLKLRVFSLESNTTASRLIGTFTAHLEPGTAPLSDEERRSTLKSVSTLVNASFHHLQARNLARKLDRDGKVAGQELERVGKENAGLLQAQEQYRLTVDTLQQQVDGLAQVNSDLEADVKDLQSRLEYSEACRTESAQQAVQAQQQLVRAATAADQDQVAREGVSRLQDAVEEQRERVRVLEKRTMKSRLQVQQLVDEVGRLKKTEERDKIRIAELEKQLAVAQQQQIRAAECSRATVGGSGQPGRPDAGNSSYSRVRTSTRGGGRRERVVTVQKLKQMRLAEELRCLAALEVRELHTRQGEMERGRRTISARERHIGDKLRRGQHSEKPPSMPPV